MPALLKLFLSFFQIGAVSFGGGWTVVGLIRHQVVGGGMMTDEGFRQAVGIAQLTPGPVALNVATLAGYSVGGAGGALLATLAVVLAPVLLVALTGILAARFAGRGGRLQEGLRIGALSMTLLTAWNLAAPEGPSARLIAFSAIAFGASFVKRLNPALVIVGCGALNLALGLILRALGA